MKKYVRKKSGRVGICRALDPRYTKASHPVLDALGIPCARVISGEDSFFPLWNMQDLRLCLYTESPWFDRCITVCWRARDWAVRRGFLKRPKHLPAAIMRAEVSEGHVMTSGLRFDYETGWAAHPVPRGLLKFGAEFSNEVCHLWAGIYWLNMLCNQGKITPADAVVVLQQMVKADLPWNQTRQLKLTYGKRREAVERYERMKRDKFEAQMVSINLVVERLRTEGTLPANIQTVPLPDEGIPLENGVTWRLVFNVRRSVELQALSVRITHKQQGSEEVCELEQAESFAEVENLLRNRLERDDQDTVVGHFRATFARFVEQLSWEV